MTDKNQDFEKYYTNKCNDIKWFEPYIQPKMIEEWNNGYIKPGINLLDVGGGCSLDSVFYATNGVNTDVIDFSQNALKKLSTMADFYGVDINGRHASILDSAELEDVFGKYDVITDNGCFHHIDPEDRSKYFESVYELLKPEGILYIRAVSEYMDPSKDNKLKAYRISSDDILQVEVLKHFKVVELSLFDSVSISEKKPKMWFIKLQKRS